MDGTGYGKPPEPSDPDARTEVEWVRPDCQLIWFSSSSMGPGIKF